MKGGRVVRAALGGARALGLAALVLVATVLGAPAPGGAQAESDEPGADTAPPIDTAPPNDTAPLLVFSGARLEGDGPWTSYLGAAATRVLLVSVGNIGDAPSSPTPVELTLERGMRLADGTEPVLPALGPGDTATLQVGIELPALAIGTYGIEGSVPGVTATGFRAETTHVPWVLVFVPAVVLVQLALVAVRNRVRRRLHPDAIGHAPDADGPARAEELTTVIAEELDAVFGTGLEHAAGLGDAARAARVGALCREVTQRVARRVRMTESERVALGRELTLTMLGELGLGGEVDADDDAPSRSASGPAG